MQQEKEPQEEASSSTALLQPAFKKKKLANAVFSEYILQKMNLGQRKIVSLIFQARLNIFITGSAGTGKTFIVKNLPLLCSKNLNLVLTASTGTAACLIKGTTIHSFIGLTYNDKSFIEHTDFIHSNYYNIYFPNKSSNLNNDDDYSLNVDIINRRNKNTTNNTESSSKESFKNLIRTSNVTERLQKVDILVIDEASMISAKLLNFLDAIAKVARINNKPFGGIQVVLCGDFYQLPPTNVSKEGWIFESVAWHNNMQIIAELTKPFRTKNDIFFFNMLNKVRKGQIASDEIAGLLSSIYIGDIEKYVNCELSKHNKSAFVVLYSTNKQADEYNNRKLIDLVKEKTEDIKNFYRINSSEEKYYIPIKRCERCTQQKNKNRLKTSTCPLLLNLAINAQVIIIKTVMLEASQVNDKKSSVNENESKYRTKNTKSNSKRMYKIVNGTKGTIKSFKKVDQSFFDSHFQSFLSKNNFILPEVEFEGFEFKLFLIHPIIFYHTELFECKCNYFIQLPLRLGWALTIHRSQGMTIKNVIINLDKCFTPGQLYVALSRSQSLKEVKIASNCMQNLKFHPHDSVTRFFKNIQNPLFYPG